MRISWTFRSDRVAISAGQDWGGKPSRYQPIRHSIPVEALSLQTKPATVVIVHVEVPSGSNR